jgi:hypothetical protein
LGYYGTAPNQGSFVYSDSSSDTVFSSTEDNSFNIRAENGIKLESSTSADINLSVGGVSIASIQADANDLVINAVSGDINLTSVSGITTNCDLSLGDIPYDFQDADFRTDTTYSTGSAPDNVVFGFQFTPNVDISINTILIPLALWDGTGSSRDFRIWDSNETVLAQGSVLSSQLFDSKYQFVLPTPLICSAGNDYVIGALVKFTDDVDFTTTPTITGSSTGLFTGVVGLQTGSSNPTIGFPGNTSVGKVMFVYFRFDTLDVRKDLTCNKVICDEIIIGNPPVNYKSTILSHIDYSTISPPTMMSSLTVSGGTNKMWGHSALYIAGVDLLGGRVVALKDQTSANDNIGLEVEYLQSGTEASPTVSPIGITQHDCLAGEKITVCILGYTTAICENGDGSPERGSQILAGTDGKINRSINDSASANEARLGFVAQSTSIGSNGAILVYYDGFYQPS